MATYNYKDRLLIAHGTFAGVATLITAPLAILAARWLRYNRNVGFYPIHAFFQGLTFVFVVVAFALGVHAVGTTGGNGRSGRGGRNNSSDDAEFSGPQADFHHRFGLAVFILVVIQSLLGLASHYTRGPDLANPRSRAVPSLTAKRSLVRYLHVVLGVAVMTMLYVQTADGVTHEWDQRVNNGTVVPSAVKIVFWTLVGVEVGLWVLGLAVEPVRNRMKRRSGRDGKRGGKEAGRKEIKRVPPPARTSTDRTL